MHFTVKLQFLAEILQCILTTLISCVYDPVMISNLDIIK
jgi:hypothetical protein